MVTIVRLDPPIELETPKGYALAHLYKDHGIDALQVWVCFCDDGQIWEFQNSQVRACRNFTADRTDPEKPRPTPGIGDYAQKRPRRRKTSHTNDRRRV